MHCTWTQKEQKSFTKALETCAPNPTDDIWLNLSEAVGTRSPREVHMFAFDYLLQLQAISRNLLQDTKIHNIEFAHWTTEEDCIFEQFLTVFPETEENRWDKISGALCARRFYRSPEEVERHYLKLVFDVNNVVAGERVFQTFRVESKTENDPSKQSHDAKKKKKTEVEVEAQRVDGSSDVVLSKTQKIENEDDKDERDGNQSSQKLKRNRQERLSISQLNLITPLKRVKSEPNPEKEVIDMQDQAAITANIDEVLKSFQRV